MLADEHRLSWRRLHAAERFARLHALTVEQVLTERGWAEATDLEYSTDELHRADEVFNGRYLRDLSEYWHVGLIWLDGYLTHNKPDQPAEVMARYLTPSTR